MQKGKQLGEYSFKTNSHRAREDGKLELNFEGSVTSFGTVIGTMTVTVGVGKSGQYEWRNIAYRDDGTVSIARSEGGAYKSVGMHRWATNGVIKVDGKSFIEEGEMELATKSWSGKFYEAL